MGITDWTFDALFMRLSMKVPLLGEHIALYYSDHDWFKRMIKFAFSAVVLYWILKAPMVLVMTHLFPKTFAFVPDYIWATFFSGIILTVASYIVSETWVWGERR